MSPTILPSKLRWIHGSFMTDGGMVESYMWNTTATYLVR